MTDFTEDFRNIMAAFQTLQNHFQGELSAINSRISDLEYRQNKDDEFYTGLETLLQMRNK